MKKSLLKIIVVFLISIITNENIYSQPLAYGKDKFIGNVFGFSGVPKNFDKYWNQITPENSSKWASVEGTRDVYNWGRLDEIYNYAKQRGYPFKFHTLIWGQQYPNWITSLSVDEQREEIEEWIRLAGERYPNTDLVDVVNEPLPGHNPPPFRNALGGAGSTGWDWVIKAFELARQYFPKAKLILNDYNIINDNYSTTQILNIVNLLKARNLIDGIGIQAHRFELESTPPNTLKSNLDRLAATGLPIYISEFDLGNLNDSGTPDDNKQLELYKKIFPLLWEHPGVKGITFWGYIENQMWQRTAFLLRADGTERPALQWLREYLLGSDAFRSVQSGNWNDVNTWEEFDGSQWIKPSTKIPNTNDNLIIIQSGHTITLTSSDSVDQLIISESAKLKINKGVELKIKDGLNTDLSVYGQIENFGTITKDETAEIKFMDGSKYLHLQDGGSIPVGSWSNSSTIELDSLVLTAPLHGNQNFGSIIWNCPKQVTDLSLGWNGNTISGNINIINTGSGKFVFCNPAPDAITKVTIQGDVLQNGGEITTHISNESGTSVIIEHNGNINISSGKFLLSGGNQGGSGETIWKLNQGNLTIKNATIGAINKLGSHIEFARIGGTQNITLDGITFGEGGLPIEVDSGVVLNAGVSEIKGEGKFVMKPGSTLQLGHRNGVDGVIANTGERQLSENFIFSGTVSQFTGELMPDTVKALVIDNSSGITLTKDVMVQELLEMKRGGISVGNKKLIYGENVTLKYSGTAAQTTSDVELPQINGPKNLTITNISSSGVTLHAAREIKGLLELSGKLKLGNNDLKVGNVVSTGSTKYVVTDGSGMLKLAVSSDEVNFPVGTTRAIAPVWISKSSGGTNEIGVRVEEDSKPALGGGRVTVKWEIREKENSNSIYTLRFGWVSLFEDATFRKDREGNARIYNLEDTTEVGIGEYITQFTSSPYTIQRSGIDKLGFFGVGKFKLSTDIVYEENNIPNDFYLSQNFPNPFNPSTKINFTVPVSLSSNKGGTYLKLKVYNILGSEISTLAEGIYQPGTYTVEFNASNLSSGVYIYQLIAGNKILTKKMILQK